MSRRETRKALVSLSALILAFVAFFILFVQSPALGGAVIDFVPPTGTITGTTTITTSFGYVCTAWQTSGAEEYLANGTTRTLTGIGMTCRPELFGSLQVPVGPEIFVIWLVSFAVALGLVALYLLRKSAQGQPETPEDITRNVSP